MSKNPKIRSDLIYQPDPEEESRIFVKDPIRREYFRYNALQIEMMQLLDGERSLEDVRDELEEEYDAEIPLAGIERFVARLEKNLLLDLSSYRVNDDKTRKQILNYLDKRNLVFRVKARDSDAPEGRLFEKAIKELHRGDPCKAAGMFEEILELNPKNERARMVLESTHEAFFKTKIVSPSHTRLIHLFDPDRLLNFVDRVLGRFIFSPLGVIVVLVVIVTAIGPAISMLSTPNLLAGFGLADIFVLIAAVFATGMFHELSHGLACKHYGGTVDDVGIMLFYGVMPYAYCDTSDSYTFPKRRHKVIVQLAGMFGHVFIQAVVYHLLAMTDPGFPLWKGLALTQLVWLFSNLYNLIPFVKYDGYYALTDYLNLPNLRERSFQFVQDWMQEKILGVPADTPEPTPRERKAFILYGPAACIYTVWFIYAIWISFLLPLVAAKLGTVGVVFAALYFVNLVGVVSLKHFLRFLRFVFRERRRVFTVKRTAVFAAVGALIYAGLSAPWPMHIDGSMTLEPHRRAVVRAVEPGFLASLEVKEGDLVEAGQVIAVLESEELARDLAIAQHELKIAESRLAILERGARSEEVAVARARTRTERTRRTAARGRVVEARRLRDLDVGRSDTVLAARAEESRRAGLATVKAADENLLRAGTRQEQLDRADATVRRLQARASALAIRAGRLIITSPIAGVVIAQRLEQRIGEHLAGGDELLEIHDVSRWRARVVPDRGQPLGAVAGGQPIALRPSGAPNTRANSIIDKILPPPEGESRPLIYTAEFTHDSWRSGMSGRVRIYAPSRSVAYRLIAVPLIQIVDYELWRRL